MYSAFISNPVCRSAHAFAGLPSDYCLQSDVDVSYSGVGTSINQPARWEWDTVSIIDQTGLSITAWDIRPIIGSFSNEIFLNVQDIDTITTVVWAIIPTIDTGTTQTVRKYTGTNDLYRDQGIYMTGGDKIVVADDSVLDTSGVGNLQIDLWMNVIDETVRDQIIFDKRDASNGYEIQFADIASVLNLQFEINTGSCNVVWDSSWTDVHNKYTFVYANSTASTDTFIYVNDALVGSCDLDEGTVGNNALDLVIGEDAASGLEPVDGLAFRTITMFDNTARILKFTFEAGDMSETVNTNPFAGTIVDHSSNGFVGSYEFDRDQSDISVVVNSAQLVSTTTGTQVSQDVVPIAVLGSILPFDPGFSNKTTGTFFYTWFVEPLEGLGTADWHGVTLALTGIGLVVGIAFFMATDRQFTVLGVFVSGMPISISGAAGWTPWWYIFMWWALMIFTWFGYIRMKQSA